MILIFIMEIPIPEKIIFILRWGPDAYMRHTDLMCYMHHMPMFPLSSTKNSHHY